MGPEYYFSEYSPVGDLLVVTICLVMVTLMIFSFIRRSRSFRVFLTLVGLTVAAAYANVTFHMLASSKDAACQGYAYLARCAFHGLLLAIFVHYVVYIVEVTQLEGRRKWPFIALALLIFAAVLAVDVADTVRQSSLSVTESGMTVQRRSVFFVGYIAFVTLIIVLLATVRHRLYRRVMLGFYGSMAISFLTLLVQGLCHQASFTVSTFLFPVIAMFYIMHSNPYDVRIGAIDSQALQDVVRYNYEKRRDFIFMSLYMRDFAEEGKDFPEALQATIRRFVAGFFRGATLFQVDRGHVLLLVPKDRNPDYDLRMDRTLKAFKEEHERFDYDYKIVIGHAIPEVSRKNEYVSFIRNVHRRMEENTVHRVESADVAAFNRTEYVLRELGDIHRRRDLNYERVREYCQPVYNIRTGRYDTAEALMRLELPETGLVTPDLFIPLAEENGFIHALTEIILNKTCGAIRKLTDAGYGLTRISVNVSALELKDDAFCDDIISIIRGNAIPGEKIAIELTESQTDSDFELMKSKISELREQGITFYLDDFGTGYSNMERIMELPFDIIKFDRSMVIASGVGERSRKIVVSLANMFHELNYAVLYEGVEDDGDEAMCRSMAASYLQGFKYSRPVPIEDLPGFLKRDAA